MKWTLPTTNFTQILPLFDEVTLATMLVVGVDVNAPKMSQLTRKYLGSRAYVLQSVDLGSFPLQSHSKKFF